MAIFFRGNARIIIGGDTPRSTQVERVCATQTATVQSGPSLAWQQVTVEKERVVLT
jgi:hypothetical protein